MKKYILTFAVLAMCAAANATIITFEDLAQNNALVNDDGTSYSNQGYIFTEGANDFFHFGSFGTQESRYPGSTALFNNTAGGTINLAQQSGGAFTLNSIDLANLNGTGGESVNFVGVHADSSTVTQSFITPGSGEQTFNFTNFSNVVLVHWTQDAPYHQFDNVNVSAVPEPATFAVMGIGALALLRKRRK